MNERSPQLNEEDKRRDHVEMYNEISTKALDVFLSKINRLKVESNYGREKRRKRRDALSLPLFLSYFSFSSFRPVRAMC